MDNLDGLRHLHKMDDDEWAKFFEACCLARVIRQTYANPFGMIPVIETMISGLLQYKGQGRTIEILEDHLDKAILGK